MALETFSRRIGATIQRDSKSFLAADFRIQAWRPFDEKVMRAVENEQRANQIAFRTDFVATAELPTNEPLTASVAALAGPYPFYGNWRTEPTNIVPESLHERPLVLADASLKARGLKIGQSIRLGKLSFEVVGFILEEPQTIAGAMATGPRLMIHQSWAEKTGLLGTGSRAFYQLLVRTPQTSAQFNKQFRAQAPDPHWRVITPDKANRQASGILERMRGFLSFVLLGGLFLGGAGIFMIFRSRFLAELPTHLTLRCLGMKSQAILARALREAIVLTGTSWVLATMLGLFLERKVVAYATSQLNVTLSPDQPWGGAWLAGLAAVSVVALAVILPLREVLRVPVQMAFRQSEARTQGLSLRDLLTVFIVSIALSTVFAGSLKLALGFLAGLGLTLALLTLMVWFLSRPLDHLSASTSFGFRYAALSFVRQPASSFLWVVALGLGTFLVSTILFLGSTLQRQIDFSGRLSVPNLFLLGVAENDRESLAQQMPGMSFVPVIQARLTEIKGVPVQENEEAPSTDDPESGGFYRTREYVVTKRSAAAPGETLVDGPSLFGENASSRVVRASLEHRFAQRIGLQVGDSFKIEIAGVALPARVQSLRKVDWFNLRPNFFIVLDEEDLAGAPFNFVGITREEASRIPEIQKEVSRRYPAITVLDGDSIGKRLLKLLGQLSMAVFSVSLFSLGSCAFVFAGILLARRGAKVQELSLFKCLGVTTARLERMFVYEMFLGGLVASFIGLGCAIGTVALSGEKLLEIPFLWPPMSWILGIGLGLPLLTTLGGWMLLRPWLRLPVTTLFRSAEEF